jgi:hypothetical protein
MTRAQMDLFAAPRVRRPAYPASPGAKARDTSHAAAEGMAPKAESLRDRVLAEIRRAPATPEQVALRLGEPLMNVRPRCSELAKLGKIVDTQLRREAMGGRQAIVWKAGVS